jgi:NAD(P)H-dependent flavin oxidoreductase YrpB (nitropropane dioxygenase family)
MMIPRLKIGKRFASIPIIQGGMSVGISLSGLASAVANAGGVGVIGSAGIGMLEKDYVKNFKEANQRVLRREIRKTREKTEGIIGVNVLAALSDADDLIEAALEEGVDVIFIGAGLPLHPPRNLQKNVLRKYPTAIFPIVSSARAARLIFKYWDLHYQHVPDGIVVEGPLAGGHLGFREEALENPENKLEVIFPEVVDEIRLYEEKYQTEIPVVAAGGIFTGEDIDKFMRLGAKGVQMATRFVGTYECDADDHFKEAYIDCEQKDIVIIKSPVGLPGRAIQNPFLEDVSRGKRRPLKCTWQCLKTCNYRKAAYCINEALTNAKIGNLKEGFAFAGANAYRVKNIISVKELMKSLLSEYTIAAMKIFPLP